MYQPKKKTSKNSHISSLDHYKSLYAESIKSPENFWGKIAKRIDWYEPWTRVSNYNFKKEILTGLLVGNSMHLTIVLIDILMPAMEMRLLLFGKETIQNNQENLRI